ncbi:pseudouridylate synthase 7 homolog [Anastrepha obliqua]|uniref:pseudouridylate synthase 7 homolog n=1 Tax=Anastrepha obliqua TaxID=95512 RepID=UPI00240A840C|nr:pseudouridylate synthase 7 homolog [Anastrepha obliqua]
MGKDRKPFKKQSGWRPPKRTNYPSASSKDGCYGKRENKHASMHKREYGVNTRLSLREDQVGITEFVNESAGFTGIVKSRFSDFHVNEIDPNGKVLHLNDLSVPKAPVETLNEEELATSRDQFGGIITADIWEKISALAAMKAKDPAAHPIDINVSNLDKEKRTQIHNILKQLYGQKLVSSTINETKDSKEERFVRISKPKGKPGENRKQWTFPGEYVHFLLYKENMETSEAASRLASRMCLHPSQVNYCGTKDKRAKTTQKFCIKRREPSHILSAAQMSKVRIGNFEFSNDVLKLGDLKGNQFRIALRHVNGDEDKIEEALQNLRDNGFLNYFGLQRFGNHPDIPTYEVGVALLKSDYKTVAELILKPRANDVFFMDKIRNKWWTDRDSAAAAAMFKSNDCIEKKLLDGLAKYGENDYSAALRKIPRNMLLLYPHAFQSLVFNRIASRRVHKFGLKLISGDLVYRNKEEVDGVIEETSIEAIVEDSKEGNEAKEEVAPSTESTNSQNCTVANEASDSIFKRKVKALSIEDISSGNYTLFDVVLPLPGYDITYPNNEVGTWYEEILEEYGLSSDKLRHNVKTYAMAGTYRKLLIRPRELTWKFRKYASAEETLIASDWDYITGKGDGIEKGGEEGKLKALLLDFCLPQSVYATMLVRELLKMDTSAMHQIEMEYNEMNKANNSNQSKSSQNEDKEQMSCDKHDNESDPAVEKRKFESDVSEEVEVKKSKIDG